LFKDLRLVIVDKIHSFAGDDRGWHLSSLLERLTKMPDASCKRALLFGNAFVYRARSFGVCRCVLKLLADAAGSEYDHPY